LVEDGTRENKIKTKSMVKWRPIATPFHTPLHNQPYSPTTTSTMTNIEAALYSAVNKILAGKNYEESFAFYRFWFEIGQTHFEVPPDQIFYAIWDKRATGSITKRSQPVHIQQRSAFDSRGLFGAFGQMNAPDQPIFGRPVPCEPFFFRPTYGQTSDFGRPGISGGLFNQPGPSAQLSTFGLHPTSQESDHISHGLIHPTVHSILRFASDAESDRILAPYNPGLQHRLCAKILQDFFSWNLAAVLYGPQESSSTLQYFYGDANFIAHWTNLGYVGEADVRSRILQSLISHPKLHGHQADALIILFKIAGAAFEAYVDSAVVDCCFELLKDNYTHDSMDWELFQVRAPRVVKGGGRTEMIFRR
jgi:hypothetical protein